MSDQPKTTKDYTRESLRTLEEIKSNGTMSLRELEKQGNQIREMEQKMDRVHDSLTLSSKLLTGIESWWGMAANWMTGATKDAPVTSHPSLNTSSKPKSGKQSKQSPNRESLNLQPPKDDIDQDLNEMLRAIKDIKSMAIDMGTEIDSHTDSLDRVDRKVERETARIKHANLRVHKML
eukprot:TRINITY_DN1635_c0_g1_i1.p1 TRINITY_DN1635_c0_g1~~TRINITY_DN1635_c0_g1_i1.p1  ORF type:complete len:178 (+),score=38.47 TRINITY_DN1635_c0_g1_i1:53-586(+)